MRIICRILPEGEIAADSPAVTPAIGLKRHSQQLVASNAAAASKAAEKKGSKGSSTRAAWRLQCPSYVNPFTLNAQLKGWLEAGKAEVALKRLWHKAKPRGAYGPKGAGRWPHNFPQSKFSS